MAQLYRFYKDNNGQNIWDKVKCDWEHGGEHIVNLRNMLRTHCYLSNILRTQWELDRNNKNPTTPHPPQKHLLPTRKLLLNVMWSLQRPKCGAVVWFLVLPRAPLGDCAWFWSGNCSFLYSQWVFSFFGKKTLLRKAVGYTLATQICTINSSYGWYCTWLLYPASRLQVLCRYYFLIYPWITQWVRVCYSVV